MESKKQGYNERGGNEVCIIGVGRERECEIRRKGVGRVLSNMLFGLPGSSSRGDAYARHSTCPKGSDPCLFMELPTHDHLETFRQHDSQPPWVQMIGL